MTSPKFGCGDNSCVFDPPSGMGTNGGCRCFDALSRDNARQKRNGVLALRGEVERLGEAIEGVWTSLSMNDDSRGGEVSFAVARALVELRGVVAHHEGEIASLNASWNRESEMRAQFEREATEAEAEVERLKVGHRAWTEKWAEEVERSAKVAPLEQDLVIARDEIKRLEALASPRDEREDALPEPKVGERWLANVPTGPGSSVERTVDVLSVFRSGNLWCECEGGARVEVQPYGFIRRLDQT